MSLPTGNSRVVLSDYNSSIDNYPGKGTKGKNGAGGFVVIYWDKEAEA